MPSVSKLLLVACVVFLSTGINNASNLDTVSFVMDVDADGHNEIFVYDPAQGICRCYKNIEATGIIGSFLGQPSCKPYDCMGPSSNLKCNEGLRLAGGSWYGDNGRHAFILGVNRDGQFVWFGSTMPDNRSVKQTWWWGWSSKKGMIDYDTEEFFLARIDDDLTDDVVVVNRNTARTRFYKLEYNNGDLIDITPTL